jgi:Ca2+-binding RTX toxin-like protein
MPVTYGTAPTQVNSPSPNDVQNFSTVADIPGFGYVVLWQGPGYNTTFPFETGIFGQCYNYAGEKVGNQFQVTGSDTTGYLSDADVTAGANGTFNVTWSGPDGNYSGIFMRPFSFGGYYAGSATQVNTVTDGGQEYSQVTHLANGNTLVTWESTGSAPGVFARLYDSSNQPLGGQFQVNSSPAGFVAQPSVTGDVSGGFVIVWQNAPGSNDTDVIMQRFDANGGKVGAEILMSSIDHGAAHDPVITTLANGTYVVAWDVAPPGYAGQEIIAQRFGLNGEKIGDEVQVTAGAEYTGRDPAIIATTDGGFAITYYSGTQIMLRTFDSQGNPVGDPWPIAEDQGNLQFQPDIAQLGDGSFIVSWSGNDVFTERFHIGDYLTEGDDRAMGTSGSDYLEGFGGNDILRGGEGDDLLEGGLGADRMIGGLGRDEATYANAASAVSLNLITGGHGGDAQGDRFEDIEQFSLSHFADRFIGSDLDDVAYGLGGDDNLAGGKGFDLLDGGDGNDLLEGGGDSGDVLNGGDGFDEVTYVHDNFGLAIDLERGYVAGAALGDTFFSIEKFTLSRFNDAFSGAGGVDRVSAGIGDDTIDGRAGNDLLEGNDGNDILNGGTGMDLLTGGKGDDVYYVDNVGDQVVEGARGGTDVVYASASYVLGAGNEVEVLSAFDQGGTGALDLTGNAFAQTLIGNAGGNMLNGGGGADVLYGLGGNDTYAVDSAGDLVIEGGGQGNDAVYAMSSYTLTAGQEIEVLSAWGQDGTGALSLTGNSLAQTLIGNAGDNMLNGGGGTDAFYGLGGNDTYVVDSGDDQVIEYAGQGSDAVYAISSYTLTAGQEVEVLSLFDRGGSSALSLTGNALAQTLIGNAGGNLLDGGGGADVLYGLGGNDTFAFTTALGANNQDLVVGFEHGGDKIALDDAIFTQLGGLGQLNANAFATGTAAHDADDRIIYDGATGHLFYDADGAGAGSAGAILFATLQGAPTLAASDFQVI